MFVASMALAHAFQKTNKMQLPSNLFSTDFSRALDFEPWRGKLVQRCYMQFVLVLENITFCSLFTNHLRPFRNFNHTVAASSTRRHEMQC